MERFLLALCGIPSSGKTTLARAIKDHLMKEIKVEIVSTDRWRDEEFYSDFKPEKERRVRREALEKTRRLVQDGMSVIHDDTNYYASMRHELFAIAR
ncbi:MAG: AAA family ATPase, partial [Candidatus Thorarchaeota archaeon]